MNKSTSAFLAAFLYILLGGSSCTETTITTEVRFAQKISDREGNFNGNPDSGDQFGASLARIGDLEGDGVVDLVVGAPGDDDNGDNRGAVWVLFMDSSGRVDIAAKISELSPSFTGDLDNNDRFGTAVAGIGDLNGDGFLDIAVGAPFDDDGGDDRGALWILFLAADGSVQSLQKISDQQGGFGGRLDDNDLFGSSVAAIGDLDGDGITDLAVGAPNSNNDSTRKGSLWILFMNSDGTVRSAQKVDSEDGGFDDSLGAGDRFAHAVAPIGDLNGDGRPDLVVGAELNDTGGTDRGAIWVLFMNANGTVADERRIGSNEGDFEGNLSDDDRFGSSIASIGDQNANGVVDLAVGAPLDDDGGSDRGAVWVLFMKTNGEVDDSIKISSTDGNFDEDLSNNDRFGSALAGLGNLDGSNNEDFAVGAPLDDDGEDDAGAAWVLFMERREDEERNGFFN